MACPGRDEHTWAYTTTIVRYLVASTACVAVFLSACSHNDSSSTPATGREQATTQETMASKPPAPSHFRAGSKTYAGATRTVVRSTPQTLVSDPRLRLADGVVYGVRDRANGVHSAIPGLNRGTGAGHRSDRRNRRPWEDARSPAGARRGYAAAVADHPGDRGRGAGGDNQRGLDACSSGVRREGLLRISPGDHDYGDRLSAAGLFIVACEVSRVPIRGCPATAARRRLRLLAGCRASSHREGSSAACRRSSRLPSVGCTRLPWLRSRRPSASCQAW